MNTPAHVIINLTLINTATKQRRVACFWAVMIGALLPDIPMFIFYLVEAIILGKSQAELWGSLYFLPAWQNFFDAFNSIPFILVGFAIAAYKQSTVGVCFFLSMLLHVALDLPLHHDDGHHHFFPFSSFRFDSPISYWDRRHYGGIVATLEALATVAGCVILYLRASSMSAKITSAVVGTTYTVSLAAANLGWLFS